MKILKNKSFRTKDFTTPYRTRPPKKKVAFKTIQIDASQLPFSPPLVISESTHIELVGDLTKFLKKNYAELKSLPVSARNFYYFKDTKNFFDIDFSNIRKSAIFHKKLVHSRSNQVTYGIRRAFDKTGLGYYAGMVKNDRISSSFLNVFEAPTLAVYNFLNQVFLT